MNIILILIFKKSLQTFPNWTSSSWRDETMTCHDPPVAKNLWPKVPKKIQCNSSRAPILVTRATTGLVGSFPELDNLEPASWQSIHLRCIMMIVDSFIATRTVRLYANQQRCWQLLPLVWTWPMLIFGSLNTTNGIGRRMLRMEVDGTLLGGDVP